MILYIAKEMSKIRQLDFGSGYNPLNDYETCDIYGHVDHYFDPIEYKIDVEDNTFDIIRCRNVIHHIKDIRRLSAEFHRIMKGYGILEITEARQEHYKANYFLDCLWYRFVIPRHEVWFSKTYRDCRDYFNEFVLEDYQIMEEKERFIFIKKMDKV